MSDYEYDSIKMKKFVDHCGWQLLGEDKEVGDIVTQVRNDITQPKISIININYFVLH